MHATLDYPNIRQSNACPLCGYDKPQGAIVCWACYGRHHMRYGEGPHIAAKLRYAEDLIASVRAIAERKGLATIPLKTNSKTPEGWGLVEGGALTAEQWNARARH